MAKTSEFCGDISVFLGLLALLTVGSKSDVPEDIQPSVDLPEDEGPDMKNASRNPSTGNDNEDTNGTMGTGHHENWGITRLTHVDFLFYLSIIFYLHLINEPSFRLKEPLDVRGQAFFEVNCEMVNSLIQKTRTPAITDWNIDGSRALGSQSWYKICCFFL